MNLIKPSKLVHGVYRCEYFIALNVLFTNIYLIHSRETALNHFQLHFWLWHIINITF